MVKASKWEVLCRKKEEEEVELGNASQVRQGVWTGQWLMTARRKVTTVAVDILCWLFTELTFLKFPVMSPPAESFVNQHAEIFFPS